MGMSLDSKAGYGILVPVHPEDQPHDVSTRLEDLTKDRHTLEIHVSRLEDYICGAAVFLRGTVKSGWDGTPIVFDYEEVRAHRLEQLNELKEVALALGIEFKPQLIFLPTYW